MAGIDLDYAKRLFECDGGFTFSYNARHNSLAVKHARLGETIGRFYLDHEADVAAFRMTLQTLERRIAKRAIAAGLQ